MYNYSIIIPHYNIPNLLIRCLKSIPKRDDIQVIVIDDGSPNADGYLDMYPELTASGVEFHSVEHQGLAGEMRNIGLKYANGKWVLFLDADDLLADGTDGIFTNNLNSDEDIVFCYIESVMSDNISVPSERFEMYRSFFTKYFISGDSYELRYIFHPLWGKIFRRDFIVNNKICFDKTKCSNDVFFSVVSGHLAKKIKVIDRVLYVVTQRQGSLSTNLRQNGPVSSEEYEIRLKVAIKSNIFLRQNMVMTYDNVDPRFLYFLGIRSHNLVKYYKYLLYFLFSDPKFALHFIKRDATYPFRLASRHFQK